MRIRLRRPGTIPRPPPSPAPAEGASPTWRCAGCGTERHFPGPVPAAAAVPCAGCGANTVAAVRDFAGQGTGTSGPEGGRALDGDSERKAAGVAPDAPARELTRAARLLRALDPGARLPFAPTTRRDS